MSNDINVKSGTKSNTQHFTIKGILIMVINSYQLHSILSLFDLVKSIKLLNLLLLFKTDLHVKQMESSLI